MISQELFIEFVSVVDEIHQLYLDCSLGFVHNKKILEDSQQASIEKLDLPIEQLDKLPISFGRGAPGESIILQQTIQKDFKLRNQRGGKNHVSLGNLCIVQLYQYWEDHYREEIAKLISIPKNQIVSDLFGDLRLFRLSIIHHRGIAKTNIRTLKILIWFNPGDLISFSADQMDNIFLRVKDEVVALQKKYCS